ncbi:RpiB/LacA/LacB family sugar-phosphate isomerase [Nanoarchaeota archaeon]
MSKIYIGSDHAGFKLKEKLKVYLAKKYKIEDLSPECKEGDDYPEHALTVCKKVKATKGKGILICGTGIGMSMAANKIPGIRAALCSDTKCAKTSREVNDSNILALSGWGVKEKDAKKIADVWLKTKFSGAKRRVRRNQKLKKIENLVKRGKL